MNTKAILVYAAVFLAGYSLSRVLDNIPGINKIPKIRL